MNMWKLANYVAWLLCVLITFYLLKDFLRTERSRINKDKD